MAEAVDESVKKLLGEISFRRSHQQGVVRSHVTRVRGLMIADRWSDVDPCEKQLVKLLGSRDAYVLLHEELIEACKVHSVETVDIQKKADLLFLDVKTIYQEAQEWIVSMKVRKSSGELSELDDDQHPDESTIESSSDITMIQQSSLQSPQGFFTPGVMQPSLIQHVPRRDVSEGMDRNSFESILKEKESEVDAISRQLAMMQTKMDSLQNSQYRAAMVEEQMKRQQEDYEHRLRDQADENQRLHADLDSARERERRARTSTPAPSGASTFHQPPAADRSSIAQEDIFAISQIISDTNAGMMKQMLEHTNRQQEGFFSSMNVPVTPLQTFDGDPTKFYTFMKRFDEVVHVSKKNTASKLNTLIGHCSDAVKSHIDCCNYKDAVEGYELARALLKKRYGNPYLVSQAWVEKLMEFPKLKSGEVMGKFVGELSSAYETLGTLGFLSELECTRSMQMIVSKLPGYVQNRWRRIHREKLESEEPARLRQLIVVIREASLEMSDPVYGPESMSKVTVPDVKPKLPAFKKKVSVNVLAAGVRNVKQGDRSAGGGAVRLAKFPCQVCHDQKHYTYQCFVYKDFSPTERLDFVEKHNLCYLCLNTAHRVTDCDRTYVCQYPDCRERHNTTLHRALMSRRSALVEDSVAQVNVGELEDTGEDAEVSEDDEDDEALPVLCHDVVPVYNNHRYHGNYVLPTLPIFCDTVFGGTASNAIIDTGSTVTMCSKGLQDAIGARPIARSNFLLRGINGDRMICADVIEFTVQGTATSQSHEVLNVMVNPELSLSHKHARQLEQYKQWSHLKHLEIVPAPHHTIELLLGQDNAHLFKSSEFIDVPDSYAPYGVLTPLGWTVFGNLTDKIGKYDQSCEVNECSQRAEPLRVEKLMEKMWEIDGVPDVEPISPINKQVIENWKKNFVMVDGHIQLPLPFKQDPPDLPNNRGPVLAQLNSMKKKFVRDPDLHRQYCETMKVNLERGYTEKVTAPARPGRENFVPQFAVFSERRPGKCRIVGNASFVYRNSSLNQALHQGPNLTSDLVEVMIEFRVHPVVITADIEQMYNQVRVPPDQRESLKVLWWPDGDYEQPIQEYQNTTQMFGLISSPAAAMYAMKEGVRRYGDDMHADTIDAALRNFYVDDLIKSIVSVSVGIRLARELKALLARIGFNLTKFGSNRMEILQTIEEKDRAKPYKELEFALSEDNTDKTLGSSWGPMLDVFVFVINLVERPETRRGVLSTFASVFDPLGLVGPVILRAKMLIQEVCRLKLDWDQELPGTICERWRFWKDDLQGLSAFTVPRWLKVEAAESQQYRIHVFADASESGYGAVGYLSVKSVDTGEVSSTLVLSKARVAPIKQMSIPRLELSAAVLAVKVARVIERGVHIPLQSTMFWSDSTIALHYILSQSRVFKTFVANRVAYIQERTSAGQWRHVDGVLNVADVASRGCSSRELSEHPDWINGPDFLTSEERWPMMPDVFDRDLIEGMPEYRAPLEVRSCEMREKHQIKDRGHLLDLLIDYYSSWRRLVKAVGYWRRFMVYLRDRKRFKGGFSALDYRENEEAIVRHAQAEYRDVDRFKDPCLKKLYTFDSDGIIRVGGRLMMSNLEYEERYPAVLPPGKVAELYVLHKHARLGHPGVDRTYMETRKRMWIVTGRRFVRAKLDGCVMCHRLRSQAATQQMAPLPEFRVNKSQAPFQRIGVDFFGPIYVRLGRATVKRYGCAITCLASRAFHVEPVSDLTTSSFLQALQRFIARRGKPRLIVSDNGTNFVGARRELKELMKKWNTSGVASYLMEEGIEWKFNIPTASHHGGVWERQIRSVRVILMALVKNQVLSDESLHTYLCMVEQIINSRPLTKLTEDPGDELPLTPAHFLSLHQAAGVAGDFSSAEGSRQKWKHVQKLSDEYWDKWSASYLKDLQIRTKWQIPQDNFRQGDLALYMKQDCSRLDWPLALITKVHRGVDGKVRSVTIKTKDGVYDRPISRLIRLELDE